MSASNLVLLMRRRKKAAPVTTLTLTCTTTGAQTLTINGLTVAAGKTVTVDWGDGNSNTYTAGAGTRTHAYAGAGTWTVVINTAQWVRELDLEDSKLSGVINNLNPMPVNLTYLVLGALPGLTWTVSAITPMPVNLTYLIFSIVPGLTWTVSAITPMPVGVTDIGILSCNGVTITAWTDNAIRSIRWESSCNAAKVDSILYAILANKANFTYNTPTLDLLGGSNAAPNGTYQAADPVTSGAEAKYALVNGNGSYAAGPEWTVQTS